MGISQGRSFSSTATHHKAAAVMPLMFIWERQLFTVILRLFAVSEYATTWHEQGIDLRYRAGARAKDMDWSWMKHLDTCAVRYGVTALHLPWCVGWILTIHLYLLLSSGKEAGFPALLLLGAVIFVPRFLSTFMDERFYPHHIDRIHRNRDVL
ncbi:MAG: hypothetical protein HC935_01760 [Pseudanabaena sp. SU_2_4]|nr:hypothetical protein [Pseudanabaena sp. SU_2_4]